jgi:hypothetical protein
LVAHPSLVIIVVVICASFRLHSLDDFGIVELKVLEEHAKDEGHVQTEIFHIAPAKE